MNETGRVVNRERVEEPVFARNPDVVAAEISGEIVLLDSRNWNYIGFDDIGSRIWLHLKEPRTLSSLVEKLREEYAADDEVCRRDTELFLRDLIENGLVAPLESARAQARGA